MNNDLFFGLSQLFAAGWGFDTAETVTVILLVPLIVREMVTPWSR